MLRIGITGEAGFIGTHLYNTIGFLSEEFQRIDFRKEYFENENCLNKFVAQCDVIVHLAAMNRHTNPQVIYDTNLDLVHKLIKSLKQTNSKAHVLFSSSTQEENDNLYGKSKKLGRELMADWALNYGGRFTGMIIPNVFGPFGLPNYNSVVATFCNKLAHNETPRIDVDGDMKLIYVGELVSEILKEIRSRKSKEEIRISPTSELKVSEILSLLEKYKSEYQDKGKIPELKNNFELNLFYSYICYIDIADYFPVKLTQHTDARSAFDEVIRLGKGGQVSFSTTVPGVTGRNHYHTQKIERFIVIKGKALIQLRRIGTTEVHNFYLDGNEPAYVDIPIWYVYNIKNIGEDILYTNFWMHKLYDANDTDTYFENV